MVNLKSIIKSEFEKMSEANKSISKVIFKQGRGIASYKVLDLAKEANVSPAMIIKFCKNIGLEGFDELKFLAKYDRENSSEKNDYLNKILETVTITAQNNQEIAKNISKLIVSASRVIIFSRSSSANIAYDLFYKLQKTRPEVYFYREYEDQVKAMVTIKEDDLIFFVSNSGDNTELIKLNNMLPKDNKALKVLVTNNKSAKLIKLVDYSLIGISLEGESRFSKDIPFSSKYSLMYMLDIIFFYYFDDNRKECEDSILKLKLLINQL